MKEAKGEDDLGGVEAHRALVEDAALGHVVEQLASSHVIQHHVQVTLRLERVLERDHEGMVVGFEDVAFGEGESDGSKREHVVLLQLLHSIQPPCVILAHQHYSPKCSLSNQFQHGEVRESHFALYPSVSLVSCYLLCSLFHRCLSQRHTVEFM